VTGAAIQASVGKFEKTREMNINKEESVVRNFISGIHSVSCNTVIHVPGLVGGQPVDMLVDTG